jgi:hypothetical protein
MATYRVHASEIHPLHCDVEADSPEEAEKILKAAWKRDDWTEHDNYLESGPVRCERPGVGLEIDELRTRLLKAGDRRMGEDAKEFYKVKRAKR